jgi:hypothetical protein
MRLGYERQRESAIERIRTRARRLRDRLAGSGRTFDYAFGDEDLDIADEHLDIDFHEHFKGDDDLDEDLEDDDLDEEVGERGLPDSATAT